MSKNVLISVIVPCYNQGEFLSECVHSILNQCYLNWECIIVNDGSTDDTDKVSFTLCEKDDRIKYYKKENGGLSSARNFGVLHSKGEFILPLDADDLIGPNFIEDGLNQFKNNPSISVCATDAILFGEINERWELPEFSYRELLIRNLLFCSSIFKKKDFFRISGFDEKMKNGLEDWDFWIRLCSLNDKVIKLKGDYFYYRQKKNSMIRNLEKEKQIMNDTRFYIFQKNVGIYRKYFGNPMDIIEKSHFIPVVKEFSVFNNFKKFISNLRLR